MDPAGKLVTVTDSVLVDELMTVGLHPKSNDITENMIRKEHGLSERARYK